MRHDCAFHPILASLSSPSGRLNVPAPRPAQRPCADAWPLCFPTTTQIFYSFRQPFNKKCPHPPHSRLRCSPNWCAWISTLYSTLLNSSIWIPDFFRRGRSTNVGKLFVTGDPRTFGGQLGMPCIVAQTAAGKGSDSLRDLSPGWMRFLLVHKNRGLTHS